MGSLWFIFVGLVGAVVCLPSFSFAACQPAPDASVIQQKKGRRHSHGRTPHERRYDLTIAGFVEMADGLGKQSVELIESLQDGYRLSFVHTRPPRPSDVSRLSTSTRTILETSGIKRPGRVLLYFDAVCPLPKDETPTVQFWKRLGLEERDSRQIRMAYSMFESSRIAENWVYYLNSCFDLVVVPDEFLVKVYKDSGVTIPIFVLPLGVDLHEFLEAPMKGMPHRPFVFATFGTCDPRKNQLLLVRAFYDAFGNDPHVLLKLCWRHATSEYRSAVLAEIAAKKMTNVLIEEGPVDKREYVRRFSTIDCLVNITLGEGFSIQPREAMALGIPVIVSNNTAQATICGSGLAEGVPATVAQPARYPFPGAFGVQYACTVDDVAQSLRRVYQQYDQYLSLGPQMRQWAAQYDYPALRSLYERLVHPSRVICGETNGFISDGLVTTSRALAAKYRKVLKLDQKDQRKTIHSVVEGR